MENKKKQPFFSKKFLKILEKNSRKNKDLIKKIWDQVNKLLRSPELGKPLRHDMKNERRVHIGSFVLVYKISGNKIHFLDFDDHDKVYKKK